MLKVLGFFFGFLPYAIVAVALGAFGFLLVSVVWPTDAAPAPKARLVPAVRTNVPKLRSVSTCIASNTGCVGALVAMMNAKRAQAGVSHLGIDWTQSKTNSQTPCYGSRGHSVHMAVTGIFAHDQFPADVCGQYLTAGENIGAESGSKWDATLGIFNLMWAEPHDPATCASQGNHACNMINGAYTTVGVGYAKSANGTWFITEDFKGT